MIEKLGAVMKMFDSAIEFLNVVVESVHDDCM